MLALAGAQLDPDDANLPGACARPDGEPGDGALNHTIQYSLMLRQGILMLQNYPTERLVRCNAGPRSQTRTCTRIDKISPSPNPRVRSTQA